MVCKKYDLTRSKKWIHLAIDLILQRAIVFRFETEEIESKCGERTNNTLRKYQRRNKKVEDREKKATANAKILKKV